MVTSRSVELRRGRRQQTAYVLQILRRVDAERLERGLQGLDADAVLERPQLLERFGALERRRLERRQHQERAPAVGVQTDVPVERRPAAARIPHVRNRRA